MQCALYDAGRCRSCKWLTQPIPEQLSATTPDLKNLLAYFLVAECAPPVEGREKGFRKKPKRGGGG
ncbi:23S rRNA (uracil(747)-C(5))-methyltransferase, partial [Escherichia coli]|nr:23S rRNA (uracil(747)-C(5))-methyltransferase [Escherichia coli]